MFFTKIFGTKNQRELKKNQKIIAAINDLEPALQQLSDLELRNKTTEFKQRLANGETVDELLIEAFAVVREASVRATGLRHFDVQLIGGVALHRGTIAEMKTGEGKTLVATLATYLNALEGSVHIVTVNDYLSKRDGSWMAPIYNFLGLDVGIIQSSAVGEHNSHKLSSADFYDNDKQIVVNSSNRAESYDCDVVYGTNNEFGFDYLRTNMILQKNQRLQKSHHFAIVDEVDSILIDEARTPLIISGPVKNQKELYTKVNALIKHLVLQPSGHTRVLERMLKDDYFDWFKQDFFAGLEFDNNCQRLLNQLWDTKKADDETREQLIAQIKQQLEKDFAVDEKSRTADLTDKGFEKMEKAVIQSRLMPANESLYSSKNISLLQLIQNSLKAHFLFKRNIDYILNGGEVVLIDEHTGRKMPGRRLSEGLHQAIEAKERVTIQDESQTLASTTFQNYFRLYSKLAGMTGTADTEAYEFKQIYNLDVLVIPTNVEIKRKDLNDKIYINKPAKYKAVINEIKKVATKGAPVLLGTISIEVSELMHKLLTQAKVKHNVLNAKFHEQEAEIIAQAGEPGAVTIATNMAGRGTDIVLGGNLEAKLANKAKKLDRELTAAELATEKQSWQQSRDKVLAAGGLHIIGTERHESRRIDNQLRGRAGRQGDAGLSCFYLSMEDDLMRLFASDRVRAIMQRLGMDEDEVIEHSMVNNSIEKAQRKVETRNFDMRKSLLEYDDVANGQRQVIYELRNDLIDSEEVTDLITSTRSDAVAMLVDRYLPQHLMEEEYQLEALEQELEASFAYKIDLAKFFENNDRTQLIDHIEQELISRYSQKLANFPEQLSRVEFERSVILQIIDDKWHSHLYSMDGMRAGINLRSYAQKNPMQEYKRESFAMFQILLEDIKLEITSFLAKVKLLTTEEIAKIEEQRAKQIEYQKQLELQNKNSDSQKVEPVTRDTPKLGRNAPCHCGSGKKYKVCHGKIS